MTPSLPPSPHPYLDTRVALHVELPGQIGVYGGIDHPQLDLPWREGEGGREGGWGEEWREGGEGGREGVPLRRLAASFHSGSSFLV